MENLTLASRNLSPLGTLPSWLRKKVFLAFPSDARSTNVSADTKLRSLGESNPTESNNHGLNMALYLQPWHRVETIYDI